MHTIHYFHRSKSIGIIKNFNVSIYVGRVMVLTCWNMKNN